MLLITLRDLQFRLRRFVITVVGTALVFAVALVLSGISNGFRLEARQTIDGIGADAWVVPKGVLGPLTGFALTPVTFADRIRQTPGVEEVAPLVAFRRDFRHGRHLAAAFLIGYRLGSLGEPPVVSGRVPQARGEAAVDSTIGFSIGDDFSIGDTRFRVVGRTSGRTVMAGIPDVYVALDDAEAVGFGGRKVATAFVVRGIPRQAPPGFTVLSNDQARADLLRPVKNGITAIDEVRILLWIVATILIGAVVYLSALERVRDFASLKAVGASSLGLFAGLAVQAVVVALVASALAAGLAPAIASWFPLRVSIPSQDVLLLPLIGAGAGLLASVAGARRAVGTDPALAFRAP